MDSVAAAGSGLAHLRREELLRDLREHIDTDLAAFDASPTESQIRTILDRLGDPVAIAAVAAAEDPGRSAARISSAAKPVNWRGITWIALAPWPPWSP